MNTPQLNRKLPPDMTALAIGVVAWILANLIWFQVNRGSRLWDHEEVTYAQNVTQFIEPPPSRLSSLVANGPHGPMQALLGAPQQLLFGMNEATVLWTNLLLTAVTGVVVFLIVRRLADSVAALLAALLVLFVPGMLENAHGALTMVPATTFAAIAVLALAMGDGLKWWKWSAVLGVAVGCMTLSRPMAVAFIPGLLAPAAVWSRESGVPWPRMFRNGLIALTSALAISAWWWVPSFGNVLAYLTTGANGVDTRSLSGVLAHRLFELSAYVGPLVFPWALGWSIFVAFGSFVFLLGLDHLGTRGGHRRAADRRPHTTWPLWAATILSILVSLVSNTIGWLMLPLVPWIIAASVSGVRRVLSQRSWLLWSVLVAGPVVVFGVLSGTLWAVPGNRFTWCMEPWQVTNACVVRNRLDAAEWSTDLRKTSDAALAAHDALVADDRRSTDILVAGRDHLLLPAIIKYRMRIDHGPRVVEGMFAGDFSQGLRRSDLEPRVGVVVVIPDPEKVYLLKDMFDPDDLLTLLPSAGFSRCRAVNLPDTRTAEVWIRDPAPGGACD